jgi:iron complex outermembrane receptor protein
MRLTPKSWAAVCGTFIALPCSANNGGPGPLDELKRMSFEELMNVEVTSVSRTGESQRDAAAAIAVLPREVIRRSGATTIPDALRLVPGIHVGEQTSSGWAVSARGFSNVNSEKLWCSRTPRSIYTPLVSGVVWDVQDYLLDDLERIEVIRGPGAALWGLECRQRGHQHHHAQRARHARLLCRGSAGTFDRAGVGVRYGAETTGGVSYRVFAKYFERDGTAHASMTEDDDWNLAHLGFRTDGTEIRRTVSPCRATRTPARKGSWFRPSR